MLTGVNRREVSRFLTVEISHEDQVVRRRLVMTVEGIDLEALAQDALASVFRDDSGMEQLRYFERLLSGSTPEVLTLTFDEDNDGTTDDGDVERAGRRSGSSAAALLEPLLAALEKGEQRHPIGARHPLRIARCDPRDDFGQKGHGCLPLPPNRRARHQRPMLMRLQTTGRRRNRRTLPAHKLNNG